MSTTEPWGQFGFPCLAGWVTCRVLLSATAAVPLYASSALTLSRKWLWECNRQKRNPETMTALPRLRLYGDVRGSSLVAILRTGWRSQEPFYLPYTAWQDPCFKPQGTAAECAASGVTERKAVLGSLSLTELQKSTVAIIRYCNFIKQSRVLSLLPGSAHSSCELSLQNHFQGECQDWYQWLSLRSLLFQSEKTVPRALSTS